MSESQTVVPALKGDIGRFQLFAFGFGSIIGSAWCVLVGSWLASAGPGGAVLGFVAGGIVVACIGACYAELTSRIPVTGGEFSFALHVFGRSLAFYVGWFIALAWICVAIFEGLAVAWLFERLAPGIKDVALYTAFGTNVTRNQLMIGCIGAPLIAFLNYTGGQTLARFHSLLTYGFISIALGMVVLMLFQGSAANLAPFLPSGKTVWWQGAAGIFANCAFLLCGFQAISQVVEEKSARVSFQSVFRILVLAIGAATGFYCLVVIATGVMIPWPSLLANSLAFVEGTRLLAWGQVLVPLVLLTAMFSLVKTWNGVFLMAARTIIALARNGFLPAWMNKWHGRSGVPAPVVLVIFSLNIVGLTLGRGAVGILVDTITISLVFGYAICCIALPVLRRREGRLRPGTVTAPDAVVAVGVVGSVVMACVAIVMPPFLAGGFPPVYLIFPGWGLIGAVTFVCVRGARRGPAFGIDGGTSPVLLPEK
ncbi:MAG TPA: APC family permease [Rhizomicrobium sp.]|nr:APC family permease [Rhizomicrobium sp.]